MCPPRPIASSSCVLVVVVLLGWAALVELGCAPPTVPEGPPPTSPAGGDAGARAAVDGSAGAGRDAAATTDRPPSVEAARAPASGDAAQEGAKKDAKEGAVEVAVEARGDGPGSDAAERGDGDAAAPAGRPPRPGDLAIDEILIDPAGNDLGREWIEIVSLAGEPLDLSSIHLADAAGDVAVDAGVLAPGAVLVLGQSADAAHNGGAPVDVAYGTRLQLNNDADRIAICAGQCAEETTLDLFSWTAALGAGYQGRAVAVDPVTRSTCPASTQFGSEGSFGSPGAPNPPCAAPTDGGDGGVADGGGDGQ